MCVYIHTYNCVYAYIYLCTYMRIYICVDDQSCQSQQCFWCVCVIWLKMRSCHDGLCDCDPTIRTLEVTSLVSCVSLLFSQGSDMEGFCRA